MIRVAKYQAQSSSTRITTHSSDIVSGQVDSDMECFQRSSSEADCDAKIAPKDDGVGTSNTTTVTMLNRHSLQNTARAGERHGVSDRAVAAIASAVLEDYGIVRTDDCSEVIDRSKIRRERSKFRAALRSEAASDTTILQGLYFDGRKDKTLSREMVAGVAHRRVFVEEHVSLIQEPGSKYVGHVSPPSGSSSSIHNTIVTFLKTCNIDVQNLLAVGCDGTPINTGKKGGVIKLFEEHVGHPLQWFVCLLHENELLLRHLFEHIDGKTTGPRSFTGPLGSLLQKCQTMPIVSYEPVICDFPVVSADDLSSDQQYLYDICQAVISGHCSVSLSRRQPGQLVVSRWITLANRVLRLYIATKEPSSNLKIITEFILKVYAPVWFSIKANPSCTNGSRHLWMQMNRSRYLPEDLRNVIYPVIQRNGYFGHPENILLTMLTDERPHIRELGLRRIMRARAVKIHSGKVRSFEIPPFNFDAEDYVEMIDWQSCTLTEPPVTTLISDEDLRSFVRMEETPFIDFPRFPCHTQAVERCVKSVTEASIAVMGHDARDGFIRARFTARAAMPKFDTKCDYTCD